MRSAGLGKGRILGSLDRLERMLRSFEQSETERHVKNAVKEWLLASRSVIDCVIDTLEEDSGPPTPRKIKISKQ